MAKKKADDDVIDVSRCKRTRDGDYILTRRMHPPTRKEAKDYRDKSTGDAIWSIGKNKRTGKVVASTTARYYQNPRWVCLWLR